MLHHTAAKHKWVHRIAFLIWSPEIAPGEGPKMLAVSIPSNLPNLSVNRWVSMTSKKFEWT